jgi:hypothetical protein
MPAKMLTRMAHNLPARIPSKCLQMPVKIPTNLLTKMPTTAALALLALASPGCMKHMETILICDVTLGG